MGLNAGLAGNGGVPSAAPRDLGFDVMAYGAQPDCVLLTDANITGGQNVLSSASATFTGKDIGKLVGIQLAGVTNTPYVSTISGFTDANHVTLAANATTTVVNGFAAYGTDNLAAFNKATTAAATSAVLGGTVLVPGGAFAISAQWVLPSNTHIRGLGRNQTAVYAIMSVTSPGVFSAIGFRTGANALADRVSIRSLRVGIIPTDARAMGGSAVGVIASNFLVDDVEVYVPGATYSCPGAGIIVYAGTNSGPPAGPGIVRNCVTLNTVTSGIFVVCSQNVTVTGNQVINSGDDAIATAGGNGGTTTCARIVVSDNLVNVAGGDGIHILGCTDFTVTGNSIRYTFGNGISVTTQTGYTATTHGSVSGNNIDNAGSLAQATYPVQTGASGAPMGSPNGIYLYGLSNTQQVSVVSVSGNTLSATRCCPIALAGAGATIGVQGITITGNLIQGAANQALTTGQSVPPGLTTMAQCPGIYCHEADQVSITGNRIITVNGPGIQYDSTCGTSALPVTGNAISNCGANASAASVAAIQIAATSKATVTGNSIDNLSGHVTVSVDMGGTAGVCGGNDLAGIATANTASALGWAKAAGTVS